MKKTITIIAFLILGFATTETKAQSKKVDQFKVQVDGLGCPFCAFGLEKKFKELKGIKKVRIDIETGDTDVNLFGANGQNGFEMGLGSALTYAERYFLLKYFHISTDEDDIDNPDRKTTEPLKKEPKDQKIDFWLSENNFNEAKGFEVKVIKSILSKYDGKTAFTDGKFYGMKKEYRQELEKLIK